MTVEKARQYVAYYTGLIRHGMQLVKEERELLMRARQMMRRVRRPVVNPRKRKRKNPARPVIYHRLLRIEARKGPGHRCDAGCKKANHSYYHDFTNGAVVYGMPDGSVLVKSRAGKRLWKYF